MAWLAVEEDGLEYIYDLCPERGTHVFDPEGYLNCIRLPKGTIKKLVGKELTWNDEPVEI